MYSILSEKVNIHKAFGLTGGRKTNTAEIALEIREAAPLCCTLLFKTTLCDTDGEMVLWGNCMDMLLHIPELYNNSQFQLIYEFYRKYHQKVIHAGTPEQETAIYRAFLSGKISSLRYTDIDKHKNFLKSQNLLQVMLPNGSSYTYGEGWLYQPIPTADLNQIKNWLEP